MELYLFIRNVLAWSLTAAVIWPVMFPWAKLAYKIWHGSKPIDEELNEELWWRSAYASLAMTLAAAVFLLLDFATIDWLDLPAGPVHIGFIVTYLALAAVIMHYCFSMEDFFQGLSLAVIYLCIPTALLYVFWLLIGWNVLFTYVLTWLKEPSA
jgi:hypothetical protein